MNRVWIDLTDLRLWSGQHGGVQRVVYGIAEQYYLEARDNGKDVGFFAYDAAADDFVEASFDPIFQAVQSLRSDVGAGGAPGEGLKHRLKRAAIQYAPSFVINNPARRALAKKVAVRSFRVAASVKRRAVASRSKLATRRNQQPVAASVRFAEGDVVLILGKPWDDLRIQGLLTRRRQETDFCLVQVAYDLIICLHPHLHHPSLFVQYSQHMFEAVAASDLLLPISSSTDKDLAVFAERLGLRLPETAVIRLGDAIQDDVIDAQRTRPDPRIRDNFIACVGTIENRKNHTLLYYVYRLAHERGIELPQLVIVGRRGWLTDDFMQTVQRDQVIRDQFLILENVSDEGLVWIYENCRYGIYPSMYEGWGLPVAELLARGKPCVASGVSSIPEVGKDLVDYFSPYDTQECLDAMLRLADDAALQERAERIARDYKVTTWGDTYEQVEKALQSLCSKKPSGKKKR